MSDLSVNDGPCRHAKRFVALSHTYKGQSMECEAEFLLCDFLPASILHTTSKLELLLLTNNNGCGRSKRCEHHNG